MRARYYVVGVGRFASADSIVPDPLNPQSLSRYTYVLGNPLNYRDPSGHALDPGGDAGDGPLPVPLTEPIRIRLLEDDPTLGDLGLRGLEIIILPPGSAPHAVDHEAARTWEYVGAGVDFIEMLAAGAEMFGLFPGVADYIAIAADTTVSLFASSYRGETGWRIRPHESLPEMLLIGQDVILTGAEGLGVAAIKRLLLLAGLSADVLPAAVAHGVGAAVDLWTSGTMMAYDVMRANDEFPTCFAVGLFWDESAGRRWPIPGVPNGLPTLALIVYQ